ncbi:type II toxin-antitoxin system VapC family toxin, partial [Dolichospermum sp. ST_con]|nr:type II toxin-antitoxin system VapC family toxin [Dolichospermum sp. ST_con]
FNVFKNPKLPIVTPGGAECGLLSQFNTVPLLREIENQTIQIKRQYKIKLPDAIIAATAINQDAFLVTRNVGDFKGITGLKIENPFVN